MISTQETAVKKILHDIIAFKHVNNIPHYKDEKNIINKLVPFKNFRIQDEKTYINVFTKLKKLRPIGQYHEEEWEEQEDKGFHVSIIDNGHGDCLLLENKGEYAIIDFGGDGSFYKDSYNKEGNKIMDYLETNLKSNKIKYGFITHLHEDHLKMIGEITEKYELEDMYMLRNLPDEKNRPRIYSSLNNISSNKINFIDVNDLKNLEFKPLVLGDVKIEILGPAENFKDYNMNSLALLATYKDMKFLFTGDMTRYAEKQFVKNCKKQGIDLSNVVLVKIAHHLSKTSTCPEFIEAVGEGTFTSLVSCSQNDLERENEMRKKLEDIGLFYSTAENGNIEITMLPKMKGYIIDPERGRTHYEIERVLKELKEIYKYASIKQRRYRTHKCRKSDENEEKEAS